MESTALKRGKSSGEQPSGITVAVSSERDTLRRALLFPSHHICCPAKPFCLNPYSGCISWDHLSPPKAFQSLCFHRWLLMSKENRCHQPEVTPIFDFVSPSLCEVLKFDGEPHTTLTLCWAQLPAHSTTLPGCTKTCHGLLSKKSHSQLFTFYGKGIWLAGLMWSAASQRGPGGAVNQTKMSQWTPKVQGT